MRAIGALLVLLGALILAVPEIQASRTEPAVETATARETSEPGNAPPLEIPPVYGGIVAVTGLLMIAGTSQRE